MNAHVGQQRQPLETDDTPVSMRETDCQSLSKRHTSKPSSTASLIVCVVDSPAPFIATIKGSVMDQPPHSKGLLRNTFNTLVYDHVEECQRHEHFTALSVSLNEHYDALELLTEATIGK